MATITPSMKDSAGDDTSERRFDSMIGSLMIIRKKARKSFSDKYLDARGHKAFAQSASSNWNWRSNRTSTDHAINNALASCRARNMEFEAQQPCRVINVDAEWTDIYRQSITNARQDESALMSNKALNSYRDKFIDTRRDKAFAQSDNGSWSWRSSKVSKDDAKSQALTACRKNNANHESAFPCRIVNVNDNWLVD